MKRISAICLVSSALLLLTFFIYLFLAIRPDPDDMIISLDIREHSLYYALKMRYLFSSFRTTLILSEGAVLGSNNTAIYPVTMFLYYFVSLLLLVFVLYKLIARIFLPVLSNVTNKGLLVCISMVFAGAIYFFCSSRIEVFGWLGAGGGHLVPMVFVLLVLLILLKAASHGIDFLLLGTSALVIAGGAEHINALMFLMNICLLSVVLKGRLHIMSKGKLLYFSIFHFIAFVLIFSNPGVWQRVADVNTAQAGGYDPGNFFTMFFQPHKLVGAVLALVGAFALKQNFKISISKVLWKLILAAGTVIFMVCFLMGLAAYHSYGLGRIWFPFDLFLLFCFILWGLRINSNSVMCALSGILSVVLISTHCYRHIPALDHFTKGYDDVTQKVISAKPGEEVIVKEFPEPDLVNLVALSDDPNDQLNVLFCRFYGSKARISMEPPYSKSR